MTDQIDIAPDPSAAPPPLPEIFTMQEFVVQLEQEHPGAEPLHALRAALEDPKPL